MSKTAVAAATLAEAFRITAAEHRDRSPCARTTTRSAGRGRELRDRVDALAGGLARLGVTRGDTVALMISNRPEFHLADLAAMTLGATPFSIYLTSSPEQVAYVIGDAARARGDRRGALQAAASSGLVQHVIGVDELRRVRRRRTSTSSRTGARRARRRADADLHVGHDRPAEGRPARCTAT